jgi:DNA-directed RNA polymerase specialized sigma24 family protein
MTTSENDRTRRFDALFAAYSPDIVAYRGWRAAEAGASRAPSSATAQAQEDEALVHEALDILLPSDREVLLLAEWEGLTPEQIGVVLGCLAVTARGRLYRARRRFRAAFGGLRARDATSQPGRQAPAVSANSAHRKLTDVGISGPAPTHR